MTAPRSDDSGNIDVVVRCWVPEQPDAVVFGRLTRTGGRTELELFESLAVSDDWNEQPEPVSLCIERTDRGEPATAKYAVLTELMCTAWGTLREVYLVGVLLWGYGILELARELPTSFDLVRVASTQLEQWLKPGILRDRFRNLPAAGGTVTVGPDRAELASRVIGDRTLSLGAKLVGGPSDSRYHISQIAYLDCTSPTGLELEDVKQFVGHVRHWLCLMTGWRAGMVEVHLRANNTWYELWAEQVGAGAEIKSDTQPVLQPADCPQGPLDTFARYLDFSLRYGVLIPLLNGDLFAQFTFGENRYLNIVQAAESYEKERAGNRNLKFRACVHTLLKETDVLGADLIAAYPNLVDRTKDLRNDIVHVNQPAVGKDGTELRLLAEAWRWVLRVHFLAEITGISRPQMAGVLRKHAGVPWLTASLARSLLNVTIDREADIA